MANQGPSYGLSREIHLKNQARFVLEEAVETLDWIQECTGVPFEMEVTSMRDHHDIGNALKDGVQLCVLADRLCGPVKYRPHPKLAFHKMENISTFLDTIKKYGVPEHAVFATVDLYDQKQIWKVVECLRSLAGVAQKNGSVLPTPRWAVKMAKENPRQFSEEVIHQGKTVVSLQYGSNKGASQAGMTAYGMQRQIIPEQQRGATMMEHNGNGHYTNGHGEH